MADNLLISQQSDGVATTTPRGSKMLSGGALVGNFDELHERGVGRHMDGRESQRFGRQAV